MFTKTISHMQKFLPDPRFFRVLAFLGELFTYRWPWRVLVLMLSLVSTILGLSAPWFQKQFIDAIRVAPVLPHAEGWDLIHTPGLSYLFLAFICLALYFIFSSLSVTVASLEALHIQRNLGQRVYKNALGLKSQSLQNLTIGEMVSIYATDCAHAIIFIEQSLPMAATIIFPLLLTPLYLIYVFELNSLHLFLIFFAMAALNLFLAYRQSYFFYKFKMLAADRIALVNEWVQNIRTLRILGWTSRFESKIFKVREEETDNRVSMVTNGQTMNAISSSITFVLNAILILVMLSTQKEKIEPTLLLTLLWVVGVFLVRPFRQMPWFFTFIFDSWTSLSRLYDFFQVRNQDPIIRGAADLQKGSDTALEIKNLNLIYPSNKQVLKNMNLKLKKGSFTAVIGEVGSGKSQLLLSLLMETPFVCDTYQADQQNVALMSPQALKKFMTYLPQDFFVLNATLKQNVEFNYNGNKTTGFEVDTVPAEIPMSETSEVPALVHALQMSEMDLKTDQLSRGLDTSVGERGLNLSGGQKQRLSLSRLLLQNPELILLDDPLSALDVHTEKKLIQNLFLKEWKDKTRLLSTHRLSVLDHVDEVIFIQHGQILAHGPWKQVRTIPEVKEFLKTSIEAKPSEALAMTEKPT